MLEQLRAANDACCGNGALLQELRLFVNRILDEYLYVEMFNS